MAGKLRTLWQARGGEIAQLNIPAVFFHPPLDGRDFLYRTPRQACGGEIAQLNIPAVFLHPSP